MTIAIIGGGPAGLIAADILSDHGHNVTVYERKPNFGRKFLMAGRGGLNITHSEGIEHFVTKYGDKADIFKPVLNTFTPQNMREWCLALGEETFIGSSGRVFPKNFKASPLLRAWLEKLEKQGVTFMPKHDWQGWDKENLIFKTTDGLDDVTVEIHADATLLAIGGASWPRLGADGSWVEAIKKEGVGVAPLRPSNCGFFVEWSEFFSEKFKGMPLKSINLSFQDRAINGEFLITEKGIEGGAIYALSAALRDEIDCKGSAQITIDLKPDLNEEETLARLKKPRQRKSLSNFLRKNLNLSSIAVGLLMEKLDRTKLSNYTPEQLTQYIKFYNLTLTAPFSIERAISTAGGVTFNSIDHNFMLTRKPGVFIAGEMMDWEAPTGGYLLQACMSSGVHAAHGISNWLKD